ncbi:hypothetical protein BRADI_3g27203v3 [Brachypodium distachyon]|uniref:Uncharacterized protein n=1 Tax=Brachypodium distachyon TaxID=15368 RepID=A0A0Q3LWT9_BRADI|nr:hypothetical protein BRADI_3g27203v3 [Brachypodium distachyon]
MEELQLAVDVDEEMGCSCCPATWRRGSSRSGARGSSKLGGTARRRPGRRGGRWWSSSREREGKYGRPEASYVNS